MRRSMDQNQQRSLAKLQAQQKSDRLLLIAVAARAYELDQGVEVKELTDLVPKYLKQVPVDPTATAVPLELPTR
jgi:hypothetical protein